MVSDKKQNKNKNKTKQKQKQKQNKSKQKTKTNKQWFPISHLPNNFYHKPKEKFH